MCASVTEMKAKRQKQQRASPPRMWSAVYFYRDEAKRCMRSRAYFSALLAHAARLEALLRIFDFVDTPTPKDRAYKFSTLINRAFKRHWIPHDALRVWNANESQPMKTYLHNVREARNGVHANVFEKKVATREIATNVEYIVESVGACLEVRNARSLMRTLHNRGDISTREYNDWKKGQARFKTGTA